MAHFFSRNCYNKLLLSTILSTFTITHIAPVHSHEMQVVFGKSYLIYKIERLTTQLSNLEKSSNTDEICKLTIDIKREIENFLGFELDLDQSLNQIKNKMQFTDESKDHFEMIRSLLHRYDKEQYGWINFLASVETLEDYELFSKNIEQIENEEKIPPAQLVFGVTLTLCGIFLVATRIPVLQDWGNKMMFSGFLICGNSVCTQVDKNRENDNQ